MVVERRKPEQREPAGARPRTRTQKATPVRAEAPVRRPAKAPGLHQFISIAGNIGAGKSTAATLIARKLGLTALYEPVVNNRFLLDYYADMKRWSFTLQLEFLIRRVEHHEQSERLGRGVIQDRTLYEDPEVFARFLHGRGCMDDRELALYHEYFDRLHASLPRPDKVLYLEVSEVPVLLSRIHERNRPGEGGIDGSFLSSLDMHYRALPETLLQKYGIPTLKVDVSRLDIRKKQGRDAFLEQVQAFLKEA